MYNKTVIIMLKPPVIIKKSLVLMLLLLYINTAEHPVAAQGIKNNARLIVSSGTSIRINGDFLIHQPTAIGGMLKLTGDLIDHHGLEVIEGKVMFTGSGQDQLLSGSALSIFNDLEITSQARLQIAADKRVTVNGTLLNNNEAEGLLLKADYTGSASLIHATPEIRAKVQRHFHTASNQYHMISSPVYNQPIEPDFYPFGSLFFAWYGYHQTYVEYSNNTYYPTFTEVNNGADYFLTATGYYVRFPRSESGEVTKEFDGNMHQGDVSFMINYTDNPDYHTIFNMTGNPFPSAIDWNAEEGWSGKEHLAGGKTESDKPAWVWHDEYQNFGVIHPRLRHGMHNDISGYIPPMNGYWIQVTPGSNGEMLTMDDRVRVHWPLEEEKKRPTDAGGVIRLSIGLENRQWRDEVLIEYHHDSELCGASKMYSFNPMAPQLYIVHDEQNYSLLFLNDPEEHREILMGHVVPHDSTFFLDAYVAEDLPVQLILKDRHKQRQHVLTGQDAISFRADSSRAEDRFVLKIQPVEGQ